MKILDADPIDRIRHPLDEWALVETAFDAADMGRTETIFTVGNGYLGLRGNVEEGRDGHVHGTFVNGFHETWPIRHAEEAYGFARVGQTIVNAPDAKIIRLYVDDEPLVLTEADVLSYERRLDFASGVLERELVWRTPAGKRVLITSRRMVSFTDRHLAVVTYEVTLLDSDASITLSSQILNRQDGRDEYRSNVHGTAEGFDPRKADVFTDRVLQPRIKREQADRLLLAYRCTNSGMTIAVAADHQITTVDDYTSTTTLEDDLAKRIYRVHAKQGHRVRLTKLVSYHTASTVPVRELADRCDRTLDSAHEVGGPELFRQQRLWLDAYWKRTDVVIGGQPALQQAVRWNLFQLAQASARTDGGGVAAKGVSGTGYGGHYFWDSEIYVLPALTYTSPVVARNALRFRQRMLDAARARALELNVRGALFPWRTINGLESSAYYAASTAQYHIDADISHALCQYVSATGDQDFLNRGAIDILVETARMWADLGFWRGNGDDVFHIHGVTGPDEYTTVVNDNLYTNVMARANLDAAATSLRVLARAGPERLRAGRQAPRGAGGRGRGVGTGRPAHAHPVRREPRHPPAGRGLPAEGDLGPRPHAAQPPSAAAALPPAGHLPLPGAEAGRRRARAAAAGQRVHARAEARQLHVLRPADHGRLHPVGRGAVDHRRRGRLRQARHRLLQLGAVRRPARPALQHRRRHPRGVDRRHLERPGLRIRGLPRPPRRVHLRPAPARGLGIPAVPADAARATASASISSAIRSRSRSRRATRSASPCAVRRSS